MLEKAQKFMDSKNYLSLLKFPIKFPTSVSLSEFNTALCWPTRAYFRMGFWSYSHKDNSRKTTKDIKSETNQPLCSASSQSYPHLPVEETQLQFLVVQSSLAATNQTRGLRSNAVMPSPTDYPTPILQEKCCLSMAQCCCDARQEEQVLAPHMHSYWREQSSTRNSWALK